MNKIDEAGTRTKEQLAVDELTQYIDTMKQLQKAEQEYRLSVDQLKASLLVISIVYDILLETVSNDYQLLTDQQIMEA